MHEIIQLKKVLMMWTFLEQRIIDIVHLKKVWNVSIKIKIWLSQKIFILAIESFSKCTISRILSSKDVQFIKI